jgi:arylsulfatase A-like enzyme
LTFACKEISKEQEIKKPNILLFFIDDLGKEWISCYGATDISTPNIDALAKSGIKFNKVYGMPQCTPSRMTLLTGQYPFRHGWVNHWDVPRWGGGAHFDERKNPSLPLEMKKAGYKTCIAGKWQIDDFRVEPDALTKAGFDEYCMWTGYEAGNPETSENRYNDPYIFTKTGSKSYPEQYGPDIFKDFIIDFMKANKEDPMFIYYPMVLTHGPYEKTPLDAPASKLERHKAMVKYTDLITGALIKELEELGIRENTLVIWTTDNGTSRGFTGTLNQRKIKGGKTKTLEPGICLPFIASWPGTIQSNTESNALIDFTDFFPTFLDLANVKISKEWQGSEEKQIIDGKSFKPVLLGDSPHSQRNWILGMGGGNNAKLTDKGVENQFVFRDRVLRNDRYKLFIGANKQALKFYDLEADPDEKHNIIDQLNTEERKSNYKKLLAVMDYFPDKDNDPKYIPNPAQSWDVEIKAKSQEWKIDSIANKQ